MTDGNHVAGDVVRRSTINGNSNYNVSRDGRSKLETVWLDDCKMQGIKSFNSPKWHSRARSVTPSWTLSPIPPHRPGKAHHLEQIHPGSFDASDIYRHVADLSGPVLGILKGTRPSEGGTPGNSVRRSSPAPRPTSRPFAFLDSFVTGRKFLNKIKLTTSMDTRRSPTLTP
jgi:hypothetical protein